MNENRWQDIFLHLKKEGFDVYSPGIKLGECESEYLVVKKEGLSRVAGKRANADNYSVLCYVPKQKYSSLESLVNRVKKSMDKLNPLIRSTNFETPSFYDDSLKAHMVSIEYVNYKKSY